VIVLSDALARSYDRFAPTLVPVYDEMQSFLLEQLKADLLEPRMVVDLGAGSGRLLEKVCASLAPVHVIWVDHSAPMRALAEKRLAPYKAHVVFFQADLREPWEKLIPGPPSHLLSMLAVYHLEDEEKQRFYRRCFDYLEPGGALWNADEVSAADPAQYRRSLEEWDLKVSAMIHHGSLDEVISEYWMGWRERNLHNSLPKLSGDDCHTTGASHLAMMANAGFKDPVELWTKDLWSIFVARK